MALVDVPSPSQIPSTYGSIGSSRSGYCTGPATSSNNREVLVYEGRKFLVKKIEIGNTYNNAVNTYAYHFSNVDLIDFFRERNYDVNVMADDVNTDPYGERYIQFLATKRP